jgi:hypothetical protein
MEKIPFADFAAALEPLKDVICPGTLIRRWRDGMTVEQARADIEANPWKPDTSRWDKKPAAERPRASFKRGVPRGPLLTAAMLERLVWRAALDELVRVRDRRMNPDVRRRYMALRQDCVRRLGKGA